MGYVLLDGFKSESPTWSWKERSWKVRPEVGKSGLMLESSGRSWKVQLKLESFDLERINEVGKLSLKLVRSIEVVKLN